MIHLLGTELDHGREVGGVARVYEGTVSAHELLPRVLYCVPADTELGMNSRAEESDFTPEWGFGRATPSLETHHRASDVHYL